ncbi:MAG: hypothetical protein ACRC20_17650 [Segniliparus sp.]|uniref:mycothiol-dependent nitroreductase Rv2466c family protein n=1 Tax=Segniliparus sp. TaxID=2804064 RepID=UPI003F2D0391
MDEAVETRPRASDVVIWLDPVCPYSWTTARWLRGLSDEGVVEPRWELMSLAVLNEGRDLPASGQERMRASRAAGRLFAGLGRALGREGMWTAYEAFGNAFFGRGEALDETLVQEVLRASSAMDGHTQSLSDDSLDELVRASHERSQQALGEPGGSPIVSVDGRAFFGPVLTSLPDEESSRALFRSVAGLARISEFAQLRRPRPAHV